MKQAIEYLLLRSGVTNYQISKATGIAQSTLSDYAIGKSDIGRMTLDNAEKLYNYYKEMLKMKTNWEFEGYNVELENFDYDLKCFGFYNNEGELLGHVYPATIDDMQELIDDLNNGSDPIADGWEDGNGNTINIDGWGNNE